MSQHIVETEEVKFVYGWDVAMQTFFFQKHNKKLEDEDLNPVIWEGVQMRQMYEVEDLVKMAKRNGLDIPQEVQTILYEDKDDGR